MNSSQEDEKSTPDDPIESADERMAREMQESEALARLLMAEEAEQSFALQYELFGSASATMDQVDLVAVQQLLRSDEENQRAYRGTEEEEVDLSSAGAEEEDQADVDEAGHGETSMQPSYDDLISLGHRIGDVKAERWAFKAQKVIDSLKCCVHEGTGDYDSMCVFCRDEYSIGDKLRFLPCKHAFHASCVDEWLKANDSCPMCKRPVVDEELATSSTQVEG
jgi:hypothetical protein